MGESILRTRTSLVLIVATLVLALRANWLLQREVQEGAAVPSVSSYLLWRPWRPPSVYAETGSFSSTDAHDASDANTDPCTGLAHPQVLSASDPPPTVFFVHVPKCAGSTMTQLVRAFAKNTNGLSCVYLRDGESILAHAFSSDGWVANESDFESMGTSSVPYRMAAAIRTSDRVAKLQLLAAGGCRTLRGHCTIARLKHIGTPVLLVTSLRDPIERFISMYDFIKKTQMTSAAWSKWLSAPTLNDEFLNASSLLNQPFFENGTHWVARHAQWLSFFFYGTLHQLSGMYPAFTGAGDINRFGMLNAEHMADTAIANLCKMHVLAFQDDTDGAARSFIDATHPWANYSQATRRHLVSVWSNRTPNATSRYPEQVLSPAVLALLRNRLFHEYRVFNFAKRLYRYRSLQKNATDSH